MKSTRNARIETRLSVVSQTLLPNFLKQSSLKLFKGIVRDLVPYRIGHAPPAHSLISNISSRAKTPS